MSFSKVIFLVVSVILTLSSVNQCFASVRLKEIARIEGVRGFAVTGYGIVVGLAGTGDSRRSKATLQSVQNALAEFGVNVDMKDINSRNAAAVIITAKLPAFAQIGDPIDVSVSSIGDARSLVGGTLLLAPLKAVDENIYALAQGQVSVGGYKFEFNGNTVQKNHPTVGLIPSGATIERPVDNELIDDNNVITVLLNSPDFTTSFRVEKAINAYFGVSIASAVHAGKVEIRPAAAGLRLIEVISGMEAVKIIPDRIAKVVINERTGTVVSGGDVTINDVTISHGNIKVVIDTYYEASQPNSINIGIGSGANSKARTVVLAQSNLKVKEDVAGSVSLPTGTTIGELITSLRKIKTSTRDVITILQAIHKADALHAQLIIQ